MRSLESHVVRAPLEQVGGCIERLIHTQPRWELGPVEREHGRIEATLYIGPFASALTVAICLHVQPDSSTAVEVSADPSLWHHVAGNPKRAIRELMAAIDAAL
jgi:hypothetical protein